MNYQKDSNLKVECDPATTVAIVI